MLVSDPGSVVFFGHEVGPVGQAPRGAEKLHCRCDFFGGAFPTAQTTCRNLVRSSVFNQLLESGTG